MTTRIVRAMLLVGCISLVSPVAFAQKAKAKKDQGTAVKTFDLPESSGGAASAMPLEGVTARKGAPMGVKHTASRVEQMADEKLEELISTLNLMIDQADDDDEIKAEYLNRLAKVYWDKSENFFNKAYGDELFEQLRAAQLANDEAGVAAAEAQQAAYLQERQHWQEEAANVYMMIVDRFLDYPNLDSVLYYLGFALVQMDMQHKAFPYFTRIVRERSDSRFVPDALLNIAEYYFNNGAMEDAEQIYTEVENFPNSGAYGLAIYKKGWCYYNMGMHEQAMNQFLKVIDYTRGEGAQAIGYGTQLLREAQRDLVMVYSQVGSPENAIKVFKAISATGYLDLAIRLAEGYASQGEYRKSTVLFKKIIIEFKDASDAYRIIGFQRYILDNAYRLGPKKPVVEETKRLIGLLDMFRDKTPPEFYQPELATSEQVVRVIVTNYHKEVGVTKEQSTMEFTHHLYNEYLRLFPDSKDYAAMTLNYAILLEQLEKYQEAAERYSIVSELNPDQEVALQSAHGAVRCYYALLDVSKQKTKSDDSTDLEEKELPEFEKKLIAASERYLKMATPDAPDVVEAQFAASMVKYQYNHYNEAANGFRNLINKYPDHVNAPDAARLLLSALMLSRNISALNEAAEEIKANPKLMQDDVPRIVQEIIERKDYNLCFEYEQQGRFTKSAECFLDYIRKFPNTKLKDGSLYHAADKFFKARLVERSLEANGQLVNEMPTSPLAARALYNIADTYRRLAVYSEAARIYEVFVGLHPKHELTEEALRFATTFRSGLGEHDKAITDLRKYLQLFPKSEHVASVAFNIATTYEKQGKYDQAIKEFERWLTRYGKGGGLDLYLQTHLQIARTQEKTRGGARKAREWYNKTVAAYAGLTDEEKGKVTSVGLSAAAEAQFMEGEAQMAEMRAVELKLPEKVLIAGIAQKGELVTKALETFTVVEGFGQPNWTIAATTRKGQGLQELAVAIEESPTPRGLNPDARAIYRQGMADRATPLFERAKEAYRQCVEVARELKWYNEYSAAAEEALLTLDPEYRALPDIRPTPGAYSLGTGRATLVVEGEGLEAPNWTQAGVEQRIKDAASKENPTAEAIYNMASLLMAQGDVAQARTLYEKAIAMRPDFRAAISRLGYVDLAQGNEAAAVAQFAKALEIDPADSGANNYYAAKAFEKRDFVEAINLARKALVSDPDSMDSYMVLAASYLEMGLLDVGILVGRNAVSIYETNGDIQNILGIIFLKMGEVRQAVQIFEKAVRDDPKNFDARFNLASVTLGYMDFATASAQFDKALQIKPGHREATLGLAVAKRGADDADGAIKLLTELAKDPNYADPHFNLCLVYQENLGQHEKALTECRKFEQMVNPQDPRAKAVKMRISGIVTTIEVLKEVAAEQEKAPEPTPEADKSDDGAKGDGASKGSE